MQASVKINWGSYSKNVKNLKLATRDFLYDVLDGAARIVRDAARESIQKTSAGSTPTVRYHGKRKKDHMVSPPGFPPNTDTGVLVNSIFTRVDRRRLEAFVGTNIPYGKYLEYGTKEMKPRPWLLPAARGEVGKIKKTISAKDLRAKLRQKKK